MKIMPFRGSFSKRQWRRRGGYNRLSSPNKTKVKIVRFGTGKRLWRLRLAPKLRLFRLASPLWVRFKNAYVKMMLKLANTTGTSNSPNVFGAKRIPQARPEPVPYTRTEFENRLVLEIYKSMVSSLELGYVNK
ncbi:hypothetical protein ACS0TY_008609 [Phlomoides rotata]